MGLVTKLTVAATVLIAVGGTWWALRRPTAPIGSVAPLSADTHPVPPEPGSETADRPGRVRVDEPQHAVTTDVESTAPSPTRRAVRVTDATNAALSDALVIAFGGDAVIGEARTDAVGLAELAVDGAARIVVVAPGAPVAITDLADDTTDVTLPAGLRVSGLVRVDGAAPAESLALTLRPDLPLARFGDLPQAVRRRLQDRGVGPAALSTVTDGHGRFAFFGLLRESSAVLRPPPGYETLDGGPALRVDVPSSDVLMELRALPLVRGRIIDHDGVPVARGRAAVTYTDENGVTVEAVRHADAEGRFAVALPVRRAQRVVLTASAPGRLGEVQLTLGAVEPGARELADVRLAQVRTARLVVTGTDGVPLAGAVATTPYGTARLAGPTGADGVLVVPLRGDDSTVVIGALGHVPDERVVAGSATGSDADLVIALEPAPLLRLVVNAGANGRPAGLIVRVTSADGESPAGVAPRLADALVAAGAAAADEFFDEGAPERVTFLPGDGPHLAIATLAAGRDMTLALVDQLGVVHAEAPLRLAPAARRELSLSIVRAVVTVRGRVVGRSGAPVPGAQLRASSPDHDGSPLVATADAEGAFEIPGVSSERLRLLVVAERFALRTVEDVPVTDAPVEIVLEPATTVRVRVLDASGEPVSNALVSMRVPVEGASRRMLSRMARRVEDGIYELRDVPHGSTAVSVRVAGTSHAFEIDGRTPDVTLRLPSE